MDAVIGIRIVGYYYLEFSLVLFLTVLLINPHDNQGLRLKDDLMQ